MISPASAAIVVSSGEWIGHVSSHFNTGTTVAIDSAVEEWVEFILSAYRNQCSHIAVARTATSGPGAGTIPTAIATTIPARRTIPNTT